MTFTLSDLIFYCNRVYLILSEIKLRSRCLQLIVRSLICSSTPFQCLISLYNHNQLQIQHFQLDVLNALNNLYKTVTSLRRTILSVPMGVRLKRFYCIIFCSISCRLCFSHLRPCHHIFWPLPYCMKLIYATFYFFLLPARRARSYS